MGEREGSQKPSVLHPAFGMMNFGGITACFCRECALVVYIHSVHIKMQIWEKCV